MVRQRVRIRFAKRGDLRFIGHRDLVRLMERVFRRAGLRLGMSQGFHPKPRMSFPSALALGIEGLNEVMELELAENDAPQAMLRRLAACALAGLRFRSLELLPPGERKAQLRSTVYQAPIPPARVAEAERRAGELLARGTWPITRPDRPEAIDLGRFLRELTLRDGLLTFRLAASRRASAGPRDVMAALGLDDLEEKGVHLTRTDVEIDA